MVYSFGLMEGSTKEVGRMENDTVKVIKNLLQEKLNMEMIKFIKWTLKNLH